MTSISLTLMKPKIIEKIKNSHFPQKTPKILRKGSQIFFRIYFFCLPNTRHTHTFDTFDMFITFWGWFFHTANIYAFVSWYWIWCYHGRWLRQIIYITYRFYRGIFAVFSPLHSILHQQRQYQFYFIFIYWQYVLEERDDDDMCLSLHKKNVKFFTYFYDSISWKIYIQTM